MNGVIDKQLMSQLLKLEDEQQKLVLDFINQLIHEEESRDSVAISENEITDGKVKSFSDFEAGLQQWKIGKRNSSQ